MRMFAETFEEGGVTAAFANGTQQNTLGEMFYLLSEICKTASKPIVLMIDEVEEYIAGESAIAYKNVCEDEWYFKGHFPGNPIMPGVLITESLAQTGAIAILSLEENKGKNALFGGIDKMKFKKKKRKRSALRNI